MVLGSVQPSPLRDAYDNEIGCHIVAVRGMEGEASMLLERLRKVANAVLGDLPPSESAAGVDPMSPPNGSLQELKRIVQTLNGTLNMIGDQVTRLEKLY